MAKIIVIDGVMEDPKLYRDAALGLPFKEIRLPGEQVFRGIAIADSVLSSWVVGRFPGLVPSLTFFRKSPAGQKEPHFIHSDQSMGDWTGIFYLNEDPPPNDGTSFWRYSPRESEESIEPNDFENDWDDLSKWHCWRRVEAKFNRLLLFKSRLFHSRSLFDNYGEADGARLIQVVFGTGELA